MFKYFFVSTLDTSLEEKKQNKNQTQTQTQTQNKKWEYPFNIHYRNAFRKLWIERLNE